MRGLNRGTLRRGDGGGWDERMRLVSGRSQVQVARGGESSLQVSFSFEPLRVARAAWC